MLKSNGKKVKPNNNYHMTLEELKILLGYINDQYGSKWFLAVLLQFGMGLRASEVLAIRIWDFNRQYSTLNYRCAKTNKVIYNEPVPQELRDHLIRYIANNIHLLKDGYLFPCHNGAGSHTTVKTYLDMWSKWRRGLSKCGFLDCYHTGKTRRYRISSHSLRRLHRTVLWNKIQNAYIMKELCNYSDYKVLDSYINAQDILTRKDEYLLPILNPIVNSLTNHVAGQTNLAAFQNI